MRIETEDRLIFIELENEHPHPDTNFLKYWRWVEKYSVKMQVEIIQILGPLFKGRNYESRILNIDFLVEKCKDLGVPINYHRLNCSHYSQKEFNAFQPPISSKVIEDVSRIIENLGSAPH